MPLQNRVTPMGEIVAIEQRGLFTGNRGIIHDPASRSLTRQRWTSKAWITCSLSYRGVRREVMARRSWTELFFLDEATALAAGHRPCFECRRQRAEAFRAAWCRAQGLARVSAPQMDALLHAERLQGKGKRLHPLPMALADLPDGAMVLADEAMLVAYQGRFYPWRGEGYGEAVTPRAVAGLLTPPSTLAALAGGYRAELHPELLAR